MTITSDAPASRREPDVDVLVARLVARAGELGGGLAFDDVRDAFASEGVSATDGKRVLRRLSEAGVGVGVVSAEDAATPARRRARRAPQTRPTTPAHSARRTTTGTVLVDAGAAAALGA